MNNCFRTLLIATLTVTVMSGCDKVERLFKKEQPAPVAIPAQENGRVAMLLPDFTQLVDREGPAVVNIQASRTDGGGAQTQTDNPYPVPEDDPLYEFFRRIMPQQVPQDSQPSDSVSYGSGFIISDDGFIMTNAHVVQGSGIIKVVMTDKREFKARLIGLDKRTDVAVLKVDAKSLPTVKVGDPNQLKVGEWVAAIGAPFGFENSVTAGIVSAKGRSLPDENYVPFIQTDVAINPGNSGGPLFNLKGEVVGINSQIYSRSGGFMGISFAIPIDLAIGVADQIKVKGKVSRGQLGVNIQEVSQPLAQSFGLGAARGALVVRVTPGGSAEKAGLQAGDIILKVNDKNIESSKELPVVIGAMKPGIKVSLVIWRKGHEKSFSAVLDELSQEPVSDSQEDVPQGQSYQFGKLGMTVTELNSAQLQQLGLPGGLLVQKAQGVAARSGLQHGDIIIGLNQNPVSTVKQFEKALSDSRGNIALLVRRMDSTLFIPLRLN